MPVVYVTYRHPVTDRVTTAAVETALGFRVFRAACLIEGVELPGGREAVLPACLRGLSLDPPAEDHSTNTAPTSRARAKPPAAAERQREQAAAAD